MKRSGSTEMSEVSQGVENRSLIGVLEALPDKGLRQLATRVGVKIEKKKRVSPALQVARHLAAGIHSDDFGRMPSDTVHLLRRLLDAKGVLRMKQLPLEVRPLVERGVVFVSEEPDGVRLVLPWAYVSVVPITEADDPRGMRALLARAPVETLNAIAGHYLGRPATPPIALALEAAWRVFDDPEAVARQVEELPMAEKNLLEAIQKVGGEVDTEDLLELEREPLRLRGASVASLSRRGVGFSLERRGMLIPSGHNRHVIPSEFAVVVGARDAASREQRRAQIRSLVLADSFEPRRAAFADDPGPLAVAMAMAYRQMGVGVREGVGTPRSLISKLAQRFGSTVPKVALIAALSRAAGFWDESLTSAELAPGNCTMGQVPLELFRVWRRGGAWDESRSEPEVLRLPRDMRDTSPIRVVRELVLDAVRELGEGHWVPFEALADYVRNDERTPGVRRLLTKWAKRTGTEAPTPTEVAERIVLGTLPMLGVVDLGEDDGSVSGAVLEDIDAASFVRVTPRGRAMLDDEVPASKFSSSEFMDDSRLRIGADVPLHEVAMAGLFSEIGAVGGTLELLVTATSMSAAVSEGLDPRWIGKHLNKLAKVPKPLENTLKKLGVVLGRVAYVATGGFIWCDDLEVRELLRSRSPAADSFLDPSPPGGLLLAPEVTLETLAKRCRKLGVEVTEDGRVVRTGSTIPPAHMGVGEKPKRRRAARGKSTAVSASKSKS